MVIVMLSIYCAEYFESSLKIIQNTSYDPIGRLADTLLKNTIDFLRPFYDSNRDIKEDELVERMCQYLNDLIPVLVKIIHPLPEKLGASSFTSPFVIKEAFRRNSVIPKQKKEFSEIVGSIFSQKMMSQVLQESKKMHQIDLDDLIIIRLQIIFFTMRSDNVIKNITAILENKGAQEDEKEKYRLSFLENFKEQFLGNIGIDTNIYDHITVILSKVSEKNMFEALKPYITNYSSPEALELIDVPENFDPLWIANLRRGNEMKLGEFLPVAVGVKIKEFLGKIIDSDNEHKKNNLISQKKELQEAGLRELRESLLIDIVKAYICIFHFTLSEEKRDKVISYAKLIFTNRVEFLIMGAFTTEYSEVLSAAKYDPIAIANGSSSISSMDDKTVNKTVDKTIDRKESHDIKEEGQYIYNSPDVKYKRVLVLPIGILLYFLSKVLLGKFTSTKGS
jgi:hypothetical protein